MLADFTEFQTSAIAALAKAHGYLRVKHERVPHKDTPLQMQTCNVYIYKAGNGKR